MRSLFFILFFASLQVIAQTDTISIFFEIDKHEASAEELEKLVVQANWQKVDIISYTDYLGSNEYNDKLSIERSREIRSRLVQRGLDTEMLGTVEGRGVTGETLDSQEGIRQNRRTDIIIYTAAEPLTEIVEEEEDTIAVESIEEESMAESIAVMEVGENLALKQMSFIGGRHTLTAESRPYLDSLLRILQENPNLKIKIEGHICCTIDGADGLDWDTQTYNLSTNRAQYVYDYLVDHDISPYRLDYEGFARQRPIFPNELNEEQKQANRRVEIKIVEK